MSFTVRLITDTGPVEYVDVFRIENHGSDVVLDVAEGCLFYPNDTIRHIDVFWTKP